jgi:hypothetical protein
MTQQGKEIHAARCIDCGDPCDTERNPLRCLPCQLDAEHEENMNVAEEDEEARQQQEQLLREQLLEETGGELDR